jgi:hypothetical protein
VDFSIHAAPLERESGSLHFLTPYNQLSSSTEAWVLNGLDLFSGIGGLTLALEPLGQNRRLL